jgi:type II secretory pathway component PulJ
VLLALALSSVLVIAVYAALQHYWRLSTVGRIDAERMQLARSICRRMSVDFRAAVYREPTETGVTTEETTTEDGQTTETVTVEAVDPLEQSTVYLVGGPTSVTVVTLRPTRNRTSMVTAEDVATADSQSDLRRVTYSFDAGSAGPPGLYYRNVDQRQEEWAETQGMPMSAALPELLAPEVAEASFQYFDGNTGTWQDAWDSYAYAGLPRAIRVTLRFHPASAAESRILATTPTSPSTEIVQFTVDLPAAKLPEVL